MQSLSKRPVSDQFPVPLEFSPIKWGPTPFRLDNMWISHSSFHSQIAKWWIEVIDQGWAGFVFRRKVNYLKGKQEIWTREVFGDIRIGKNAILAKISEIDKLDGEGLISDELVEQHCSLKNEFEVVLVREDISWR